MILRPSRGRRGEDPHLQTKMRIFAAGAVIAVTGIATGRSWLVWVAVAILAFGAVLGLVGRSKGGSGEPRDNTEDDEGHV